MFELTFLGCGEREARHRGDMHVGNQQLGTGAQKAANLQGDRARRASAEEQSAGAGPERTIRPHQRVKRNRLQAAMLHIYAEMIVQVAANFGPVGNHLYAQTRQEIARTDSGMLQQGRRVDCA